MATTNIITINQLIKLFNDFSDSHLQLKDFGYGPTSEIGTTRQMNFPYLWVGFLELEESPSPQCHL